MRLRLHGLLSRKRTTFAAKMRSRGYKYTKNTFVAGLGPWGSLQHSSRPVAGFESGIGKGGREGKERE